MQCILREKLLAQAATLAAVGNVYRTESFRFVDAYFVWLQEAEKNLSGLRSSISILLQAEKTSLAAVQDGYVPNHIQPGTNVRKSQRAVAAQSLERVSREIYAKVESIDQAFDQMKEKMCHAIAVLASKMPDLYGGLQPDQQGVNGLWELMARTVETAPMHNYFSAKLASTDIQYLLLDIIQKIVSNRPVSR